MPLLILRCYSQRWQIDGEPGTHPHLAVHLDLAPVLLDDAVNLRQAQASALADRLGGEEGVEDVR